MHHLTMPKAFVPSCTYIASRANPSVLCAALGLGACVWLEMFVYVAGSGSEIVHNIYCSALDLSDVQQCVVHTSSLSWNQTLSCWIQTNRSLCMLCCRHASGGSQAALTCYRVVAKIGSSSKKCNQLQCMQTCTAVLLGFVRCDYDFRGLLFMQLTCIHACFTDSNAAFERRVLSLVDYVCCRRWSADILLLLVVLETTCMWWSGTLWTAACLRRLTCD